MYSKAVWLAIILLTLGLVIPILQIVGITALLLAPILAALYTAWKNWQQDRALTFSILFTLLGLLLLYFLT